MNTFESLTETDLAQYQAEATIAITMIRGGNPDHNPALAGKLFEDWILMIFNLMQTIINLKLENETTKRQLEETRAELKSANALLELVENELEIKKVSG